MYYVILGEDREDSLEARRRARPQHLARLESLQAEGRLLIAGPFPAIDSDDPGPAGVTGSLIVAEFADHAEARAWADDDPYMLTGVYSRVTVTPFKKVLP